MSLFAENPLAIGLGGAALTALMLILLLQTARAAFLYATIGVVVLTAALLLNERRVVTEREQVKQTLFDIAAALEANDVERVMDHVSTSSAGVRQQGQAAMKRVIIREVKIKPNLTVQTAGDPPDKATAEFNVVVIGGDRQQTIENQRGAWFFIVDFVKEGAGWKVVNYQQLDPRQGM